MDKALAVQFRAIERETASAKEGVDHRLVGMNEFRAQMSDRERLFITRPEMDVNMSKLEDKLVAAEKSVNEKFNLTLNPIMEKLTAMEKAYNRKEGSKPWEVAIITGFVTFLFFMMSRYIFKF